MMLSNRPEALIVDVATMHLGAVPLSVYNTSSPEQVEYLLAHSDAALIVTEDAFLETILAAQQSAGDLRQVFVVGGEGQGDGSLDELESSEAPDGFDFDATWRATRPDDVATLIYTSGTTGPPKGVQITHDNLMSEWRLVSQLHPLRPGGRVMSYLPMAHLADRVAGLYAGVVSGATVTCVPDPKKAVGALPDVRPTMWMAVPRIWEKLRAALLPAVEQAQSPEEHARIAAEIRSNLGLEEVDLLLSGAAPIAAEILEFFEGLGLGIYEVWGMTETTTAATCSPRGAHRVGTVGRALPGVEVKLADDGELLVRGPIVTRGYLNDPERTAEAIDADGWMHTGDVATIDADGYVRIVDRKKEIIISSAGKNMSPANIENAVKFACPIVGSVMVVGDARPYNAALVVLDPETAATFAAAHGTKVTAVEMLAGDPQIRAAVEQGIMRANATLSRVEQIKKHTLLATAWEPGGDELTPTMKLRRRQIATNYASEIGAMYE
jgi:long-subunit acyl-CoA synthetase (AMP-forming)